MSTKTVDSMRFHSGRLGVDERLFSDCSLVFDESYSIVELRNRKGQSRFRCVHKLQVGHKTLGEVLIPIGVAITNGSSFSTEDMLSRIVGEAFELRMVIDNGGAEEEVVFRKAYLLH